MEMTERARLVIGDASAVGDARRRGVALARELGLGETDAGRLALVVTETSSNLVKHAGGGELFLRALCRGGVTGVGVLALDRGPGIANMGEALRDGYSTGGSPGTGLGALARIASSFDLYSGAAGTAVLAQIWPGDAPAAPAALECGGINVPHPREQVSGDAWVCRRDEKSATLMMADGLGHGIHAAEAARAAVASFLKHCAASPGEVLELIHAALRPTRGAAVAIAQLDLARGALLYAGIGNVAGTVVSGSKVRKLVSHHGTAGSQARHIREFQHPWEAGDVLVLHSDGLGSHWSLDGYPGVLRRHASLIAGLLYRDHARGTDDTSVAVLKECL
jgi:anti-sigma regulatory factor (Ser/Thr protein kinase)